LWEDANLCASINRFFSVLMLTTTGTTWTDLPGDTRSHLLHQEHHAHSALFRAPPPPLARRSRYVFRHPQLTYVIHSTR
jgi:hypothetical protein